MAIRGICPDSSWIESRRPLRRLNDLGSKILLRYFENTSFPYTILSVYRGFVPSIPTLYQPAEMVTVRGI